MCTAIAISISELPVELVRRHRLTDRVYLREGREEFQFHWWETPTVLPVRREGRLEMLPWGSRRRWGPLPYGGWVSKSQISDGLFAGSAPEEVMIPADLGFQKGIWFLISEGIHGVAVETRDGPIVYMLTKVSSNYYKNMTEQSPTMPMLVNQVI